MSHEFSLMTNLIRQIEQIAAEQGGRPIAGVRVRLGALTAISDDHFREHFVEAALGTIAAGAALSIEHDEDPLDPFARDILLESVEVEA